VYGQANRKVSRKRSLSKITFALLEARFDIVRQSDLEDGGTAKLHTALLQSITAREETQANPNRTHELT
jgi:hypothetical protein